MDGNKAVNRFDLYDHGLFHQHVETISFIKLKATVDDRQHLLTLDLQATLPEVESQASLIRGLKKPRSKSPMHINRGTDNGIRYLV